MQFGVLGPVTATAGGRRADIGSGHQRTILAVLLAAGGDTVSTERLIDALWGDEPPASARKSLQSHLSRLRRELTRSTASEAVVTEPRGYRLDLPAHDVDAARFESLAARAHAVDGRPEETERLLAQARALWRGPAFGELASHPQVRAEAVRLERLRTAVTADHVDARLALGRHGEVVGELEAAVDEDPLDERAHGQLMLALYRGGRQAEALATYRRLRERLRDELGVDPSPGLQGLHERLLRQEPGLESPSAAPGLAQEGGFGESPSSPQQPPAPPTELIGRDEEVAAIASLVADTPLVTLTGPGGVGKTRLAEQVAAQVADRFDDGMARCALAAVQDPERVAGALITMLGIQPTGDHAPAETLVTALAERRLLLLLDNCEHVLDALTPLVEEVLGRCPNVAVLATSRERLHLPAEHVRPVGPLDVPDAGAGPGEVAGTPAGALFEARARAVEPGFRLTEANAGAVAELCRRLDGMPLAIELAAARIRALAPRDLVARLDHRFSLLAGGPRGTTDRHRTLQAVVSWSYDLLTAPEARLFDRLSVFAGSFSLSAAEQVCTTGDDLAGGEVAGLLSELVDKSMVVVEREDARVRYRLLETLRAFGGQRLAERSATEDLRRAHADYHVRLAEELGPQVRGPDEREAVARIDATIDDLRSAHAWLVDVGDVDGALRLPVALSDYVFYRLRDEMITWTHRALELPDADRHPAYLGALATAAMGATHRGEYRRATVDAREVLDRAEPDSMATILALVALSAMALYEGRFDDLIALGERQAGVADRLGDLYHLAFAGVTRVLAHLYRGQHDEAAGHLADLHETASRSGSPTMQAFARYCHGEVHLDTRPAEAATSLGEAIDLAREVNNPMIEGVALVSLASLQGRRGETRTALELFRDLIVHWRQRGNYTYQLTTLRNLVELLVEVGADESAAVLHGAVTEGLAPSFGVEAERLADAWRQLEDRLGGDAAAAAAERGRALTGAQMGEEALTHLEALLADSG